MYQYVSNNNVNINVSNKECNNIVLKLGKQKKENEKKEKRAIH